MKFAVRLAGSACAVVLALVLARPPLTQADPSDDFSFSLNQMPTAGAYALMPEARIAAIFHDRLDLFPKSKVPQLAHYFKDLCKEYRFDPAFILSLIEVESRYRIKVRSPAGAVGLMQLMPATANRVAQQLGLGPVSVRALTDPYLNLRLGVAYLAYLRDRYRGMPPYYLLAAYNLGPARLDQLASRKDFKPSSTAQYFKKIRRNVPLLRFYRRLQAQPAKLHKKAPSKHLAQAKPVAAS